MTRKLFVIAGEASGDALGAGLMAGLRASGPVRFDGVGGPLMTAQGLTSRFAMQELSVMGLSEVLPRLPHLLRRVRETADAVIETAPDALITIDSPDFCLRVARKVRKMRPDLPVIHYVAPSVWAWRPGRAVKMARHVDHVLALLPFEPPLMREAGMSCDFVGHPVAQLPRGNGAAFRAAHGLGEARLVGLLPGSRGGELRRHGPVFAQVARQLAATRPDLRFVLPTVPAMRDAAEALATQITPHPLVVTAADAAQKADAFVALDVALAASGTVSLELAQQGVPMVIGYQLAPVSRLILRRMVRLDTVTLINIISRTRAVPEFLLDDFRADPIAGHVAELLDNEAKRYAQLGAANDVMAQLASGMPPARAVERFLEKPRTGGWTGGKSPG